MKKLLVLLLCLVLALPAVSALADEPVKMHWVLTTNGNYDMTTEESMTVIKAMAAKCNIDLEIDWISTEGSKEKISTFLATDTLPDVFSPCLAIESLVEEGAIVALDPYLDKISNYTRFLDDSQQPFVRNAADGQMYAIYALTQFQPAYTMVVRKDWLDKLEMEVPSSIDEWITFWRAVKANDVNGNGDPNDEVPFVDPNTFTSSYRGCSLMMLYGIESNGVWYVEDGTYSLVYSHPRYREYLELMRLLYSEGLIDQEVSTHTATECATLFNSEIAASGYQWISRPQNTTKTLHEANPDALLIPTIPIAGPDGIRIIPSRALTNSQYDVVISYKTEQDGKLDMILEFINFLYSDEGIEMYNYGLEGVHHQVVDGKIVLNEDIVADSTFTAARHQGLINQFWPSVWTTENYNTIMRKGLAFEEMALWDQQMVKGTEINWDYYFTMPPTLATDAWAQYNADIMGKIDELRAQCITGAISVDDFFAGYEALKDFGLTEILEDGQAAYDAIMGK